MEAMEYRVSWPRRSRPGERRYMTYHTLGYAYAKIGKLRQLGFEKIEISERVVRYGDWSTPKVVG